MSAIFEPGLLLLVSVIVVVGYALQLCYLALLHTVRGAALRREHATPRALLFSTGEGDFRVDRTHRNFNYKLKGEDAWSTVNYEDIDSIYIFSTEDSAGLFEYFFSDFSLWDLSGRYRDATQIRSIRLWLKNAQEIPLLTMKQYEQRELWLGQIIHDAQMYTLGKLGLNRPIDEVADRKVQQFINKFGALGLDLKIRGSRR